LGVYEQAGLELWTAVPNWSSRPVEGGARETYRRYEWSRPGALLHVDVARLVRFERHGHAVTGDRTKTFADRQARPGYVYLHCVIDDHSRYAYVERHRDQGGGTLRYYNRRRPHSSLGDRAPLSRVQRPWVDS
jgi:hypothetical protein